MRFLRSALVRFTGLLRWRQHEAEMNEELRAHLDGLTERNIATGMSPDEARYAALRTFGGVEQIKERARDQRRSAWGEQVYQDVRYAVRQLRKSPGFTVVAVLTLALGIGACTAIYSVIDGVLIHPIDLPDAERVVMLRERRMPDLPDFPVSPPTFLDWEKQARSFECMAAMMLAAPNFSGDGEPQRLSARKVTPHYFAVFGLKPMLGRVFLPEECALGRDGVTVLSHVFWQRAFGGDPGVLGREIQLDGAPHVVIGIAPAGAAPPDEADLWLPLALAGEERLALRGYHVLHVVARLRPGVSTAQADAEMKLIARRLAKQFPEAKDWGAFAMPLQHHMQRDLRTVLFTLLGAVGCVLLIACANVANLLLARGAGRQREMAVRAAMGAGRSRLVRQLLTESVLLALLGGMAGVFAAWWGLAALRALAPASLPRVQEIGLHAGVLGVALALSVFTGVVFGLTPAWLAAGVDLGDAMKQSGAGATDPVGRRWRGALVVFEIAAALVLLVGAGLLTRSFVALQHIGPGFETKHALVLELTLPERKFPRAEQRAGFIRQLLGQITGGPGVESAGATDALSLHGGTAAAFSIAGRTVRRTEELPLTMFYGVSEDYFAAMGIRLRRGRLLSARDTAEAAGAVLINETFAQQHFGTEDPIGKQLRFSVTRRAFEIVGIVGDVTQAGAGRVTSAQVYVPFAQWEFFPGSFHVVVRANVPPATLVPALRAATYALDRDQPIGAVRTLDAVFGEIVARQRFATTLLGVFSLVALVIATVGLYGVMAYNVSRRTTEIGIRVALGASPRTVLLLVLEHGGRLVALGLVIGFAGAWAASRALESMLYHTSAHDPLTLTAIMGLLAAVALAACFIPARRASKVDPIVALRAQ